MFEPRIPTDDELDELIAQIPLEMNYANDHPLCKILKENEKCNGKIFDAIENLSNLFEDTSKSLPIAPFASEHFFKAEKYRADLEGSILFRKNSDLDFLNK